MAKTSYINWIDTEKKRNELIGIIAKTGLPFAAHLKRDRRTGKQNSRQWAMLGIIAREKLWHGVSLSPEDWKILFMQALHGENVRTVPNMNNDGFVMLSRSSSSLTVDEHSQLTDLIEAFAGQNNIDLKQDKERAA